MVYFHGCFSTNTRLFVLSIYFKTKEIHLFLAFFRIYYFVKRYFCTSKYSVFCTKTLRKVLGLAVISLLHF